MSRQSIRSRSLTSLRVPLGHRQQLAEHGLDTVGAFASYGAQAGGIQRISSFLGTDVSRVESWAKKARDLCPELGSQAGFARGGMLALGCLASDLTRRSSPVEMDPWRRIDVRTLPSRASHAHVLDAPRDQGRRGSCVAFGFVAAQEQVWRRVDRDAPDPEVRLSEQYLYWRCKEEDGHPGSGTYPRVAAAEVVTMGACRRQTWPYDPDPGETEGHGPPPPGATEEARRYRVGGTADLTAGRSQREMLDSVIGCVAGIEAWPGRVVPIGMRMHESFLGADVETYGRVPVPLPGEEVVGYHEMVVVGYQLGDEFPGGGVLLVRNSWGTGWARKCEIGPGHCFITFRHALEHVLFAHALLAQSETRSARSGRRGRRHARSRRRHQMALMQYAGARFPILAYRASKRPITSLVLAAAAAAALLPEPLRQPVGLFLTSIMLVALLLRVSAMRPHILSTVRHLRERAGKAAAGALRRLRGEVSPTLHTKIEKWIGPSLGMGVLILIVWPGLVLPVAAVAGTTLVFTVCIGKVEGRAALIIGLLAACCLLACTEQSLVSARFSLTLVSVGLLLGHGESAFSRSVLLAGGDAGSL